MVTDTKALLLSPARALRRAVKQVSFRLLHGWYGWGWWPLVWRHMAPRRVIAHQYWLRNRIRPDLDTPRDFSEKVLWLKLHGHTPLHTQCADKIRVRDYVAARLGPEVLVPSLLITDDPEDIRPDTVTADRFVVKTNHDQGGVFLCVDRAQLDWVQLRDRLARRMRLNWYDNQREPQYRDIKPGILVEVMLAPRGAGGLIDYKINCLNGKPAFIQVNVGRHDRHVQLFYDTEWRKLPCWRTYPDITPDVPPPTDLPRMLAYAATLAEPFLLARVDFYDVDGAILFGEITFHPGGGLKRFEPPAWERRIGDMLVLPLP